MKLLLKQGLRLISIALAFMLVLTFVPAVPAYAAGIAVDATNFPDNIFRDYVKDSFDKNNDGTLSGEELAAVTEIDVRNQGIADLKGVEHFKNLTQLNCYGNKLKTLDVTKNTALKRLDCNANQLTTLDVTNNTALEYLDCRGNQLTTLDVTKNTALEYLDCVENQLKTLVVTKNVALK